MTDDELTKEAFTRIANDFCDRWPKMGPSARWLNLVNLFTSVAEKARAAGYEEAREQAAKTVAQLMQIANRDGAAALRRACESIRSMKPEVSPSAQGEGKLGATNEKRLEAAEKVCEAAEKEQLSHFEAQGGYHSTVEVLEALKEWWKVIGRVAPYK